MMMLDSSLGKILSTKPAEPSIPTNKSSETNTTTTNTTNANTNTSVAGTQEEAAAAEAEDNTTTTIATTHATTTTNNKSEAEVRLVVRFFVEEQIVFNGKIEKVKQLESEELSRIVSRIAWDGTKEETQPILDREPNNNDKVNDHDRDEHEHEQEQPDRNADDYHDQHHNDDELKGKDTTQDNRTDNENGDILIAELAEQHADQMTEEAPEEVINNDLRETHLLERHEDTCENTTILGEIAQGTIERETPMKDGDAAETTVETKTIKTQIKGEQIVEKDYATENLQKTSEQTIALIAGQILRQEKSAEEETLDKIQQHQENLEQNDEKSPKKSPGKSLNDTLPDESVKKTPRTCEETLQETGDIDCSKTDKQDLIVPNTTEDKDARERRSSRVPSVDRQGDASTTTTRIGGGATTASTNTNDDHSSGHLTRLTKVFAKWSDNHFYPGTIMKTARERKFEIKFFDGPHKVLVETDLIPLSNIVTKQVRVSIAKEYCVNAIVYGQTTDNGQLMFDVEYQQNGLVRKWVPLHDIFLTAEQGLPLINQPMRADKNPDESMFAGVDLDNIVHNKRSRRLQEMEDLGLAGDNSGQLSGSTTPTAGGANTSPAPSGRRKRGQYNLRTSTNRAQNVGNTRAEAAHERGLKRSHSDVNNPEITPVSSCSPDNLKPHLHSSNSNPPSESSSSTGSTNSVLNAHEMGQDFYFESTSPHRTKTSLLL